MDFGINLATSADSWKVVKRAEELGYARAWFYDTQMLNADVFVAMGAAAVQTVADPSGHRRADPVQPHRAGGGERAGLAERAGPRPHRLRRLHRLHGAPHDGARPGPARRHGRVHPRSCSGCSPATPLEWTFEGKRRKIRFLSPDIGVVNLTDPIPLHVSALGPSGRRLTAELGAGWIYAAGHQGAAMAAVTDMQAAWRAAGVDPAGRGGDGVHGRLRARRRRGVRQPARPSPGGAARHDRAPQPGRGRAVRQHGARRAAGAGAAARALPADLRRRTSRPTPATCRTTAAT